MSLLRFSAGVLVPALLAATGCGSDSCDEVNEVVNSIPARCRRRRHRRRWLVRSLGRRDTVRRSMAHHPVPAFREARARRPDIWKRVTASASSARSAPAIPLRSTVQDHPSGLQLGHAPGEQHNVVHLDERLLQHLVDGNRILMELRRVFINLDVEQLRSLLVATMGTFDEGYDVAQVEEHCAEAANLENVNDDALLEAFVVYQGATDSLGCGYVPQGTQPVRGRVHGRRPSCRARQGSGQEGWRRCYTRSCYGALLVIGTHVTHFRQRK